MALSSKISVSIAGMLTNQLDLSTPVDQLDLGIVLRLSTGTGSGQADREFHDVRTLTTGATENLDLAGVLTDPLGAALTFATVKGLAFVGDAGNTTNLTIGNGTNPFIGPFGAGTHTHDLRPGGIYMAIAPGTGWTVTAGTGDIIKVTNAAGASATYKVYILGTSA
jgi:hypothetical protein